MSFEGRELIRLFARPPGHILWVLRDGSQRWDWFEAMFTEWMRLNRGDPDYDETWTMDEVVWRLSDPVRREEQRDPLTAARRRRVRKKVDVLRATLGRLEEQYETWSEAWAEADRARSVVGGKGKVIIIDLDSDL